MPFFIDNEAVLKKEVINVRDCTVCSVSLPGWKDVVEDLTRMITVYVNVKNSG